MGLQLGNDLLEPGAGLHWRRGRPYPTDYGERAQSIPRNFAIGWVVSGAENVGRLFMVVRLWHEREGHVRNGWRNKGSCPRPSCKRTHIVEGKVTEFWIKEGSTDWFEHQSGDRRCDRIGPSGDIYGARHRQSRGYI